MPARVFGRFTGPTFPVRVTTVLSVIAAVFVLVSPAYAQFRRVAVLDFANITKDPAVEWLGPAVAETITTKLQAILSLQLIERAQLYKVLEEQKLNLSDLTDPTQAVQVGRLLGAEQVVVGGYAVFGGTVRFTARFVDTRTGGIVSTSQTNGLIDPKNPNGLWAAFDQLAEAVIDSLNRRVTIVQGVPQTTAVEPERRIKPTPEERAQLSKVPTNSLEAQEAYGRGRVAYRNHQWLAAAQEFERATSIDSTYAEAWQVLGAVLLEVGRWAQAVKASETARTVYAQRADERGQAGAFNNIGLAYARQGSYTEALSYYERGLRLEEALADEGAQASTLLGIGDVHREQGRYAEALSYFERSLRLAEKLGNEWQQAQILNQTGLAKNGQGRYAEALTYYERSLRLKEKVGDELGQARILINIGYLDALQGRYTEALSHYERGLQLAEKLEDEGGQVTVGAVMGIGDLARKQGRYSEALSQFERSLRLAEKLGDEPTQTKTLINIGGVHALQGRYDEALSYYERSLQLAEKLGDGVGRAMTLANMGRLHEGRRRYKEACDHYERALSIADRLGMAERVQIRQWRDRACALKE